MFTVCRIRVIVILRQDSIGETTQLSKIFVVSLVFIDWQLFTLLVAAITSCCNCLQLYATQQTVSHTVVQLYATQQTVSDTVVQLYATQQTVSDTVVRHSTYRVGHSCTVVRPSIDRVAHSCHMFFRYTRIIFIQVWTTGPSEQCPAQYQHSEFRHVPVALSGYSCVDESRICAT